jgi:hypothetical protein
VVVSVEALRIFGPLTPKAIGPQEIVQRARLAEELQPRRSQRLKALQEEARLQRQH